jgi:hypothetical protein
MKKAVGIVVTMLMVVFLQPTGAQAEDQKVIAIIDNAMDSNKNSSIIYEVCITQRNTCPNGTSFQEGKGAANVSDWTIKNIDHGYNITQVANLVAPNVKVVFIRISDVNVFSTFSSIHNDGRSLSAALKWVSENASRFSIDAVSISQSRSNFTAGTCPVDNVFSSATQSLKLQGISVYAATGNEGKTNMVGFPSCVTDVVGVGATTASGAITRYTNRGPGMDATYRGDARVVAYRGFGLTISGTSVSAPAFAALEVNKK